jgi:5-methylcytosine-specific restriction endonuclease McrA
MSDVCPWSLAHWQADPTTEVSGDGDRRPAAGAVTGTAYRPGNRAGRTKRAVAEPRGKRWEQARAACFATWGTVCWLCGHPGATEADHIVRVLTHGPEYYDVTNLRPAHGTRSRCGQCGRACNQSRRGQWHDGVPLLAPPEVERELARTGPHCPGCRCRERLMASTAQQRDGTGQRKAGTASRQW